MHRSTATGVLSSYKKQLQLTAEDIVQRDYFDKVSSMRDHMARNFEKSDRASFTRDMIDRLRLGRQVDSSVDGVKEEYGNYAKFEDGRNQVKQVNDPGYNDTGAPRFE